MQINGNVKVKRGTYTLSNGQSLKACLPPELYAAHFHKSKQMEYCQLKTMYESQKKKE